MAYHELEVKTNGALALDVAPGQWVYTLDLYGEPLYTVGIACDTCQAIFERVGRVDLPLTGAEVSARLNEGLENVPPELVATVEPLLPRGSYIYGLIEVVPTRLDASQRPSVLGCGADYFWWQPLKHTDKEMHYELVLPSVPEDALDEGQVARYRAALERGERPTALALSFLDARSLLGMFYQRALVHVLLDGHHKVLAASQLGLPIRILSFLRETHPTGTPYVDDAARERYAAGPGA